jgi:hypothetical protein
VSLDANALAQALRSLAAQEAPPTVVDAGRAVEDGRRVLQRRRRAAAGIGGTGAVAVIAAAALTAGHLFGGGGRAAAPATQGPTHTGKAGAGDWDPLVAPAAFGWLPPNAPNLDYSVAPGPGQGPAALAKGNQSGQQPAAGNMPAMIWLSTLDPGAPAPKAGPLYDQFGRILIAAPDVNGRSAFWAVDPANRDPDLGAAGILYFQSPGGRWAMINAYYLGADPVTTTLLHVAATARVGETPIPLPVQISGLPANATVPVAEFDRTSATPRTPWVLGLTFAIGDKAFVALSVYPATAPEGTLSAFCEVGNGLKYCASPVGAADPAPLPHGIAGFLHGVKSLGPDPAHWTTDVILTGSGS